jgi:hypothetical protein
MSHVPEFPTLEQDPELDARCQFCAGEGIEACATGASCTDASHEHVLTGIHKCTCCGGSGLSRSVWSC